MSYINRINIKFPKKKTYSNTIAPPKTVSEETIIENKQISTIREGLQFEQ